LPPHERAKPSITTTAATATAQSHIERVVSRARRVRRFVSGGGGESGAFDVPLTNVPTLERHLTTGYIARSSHNVTSPHDRRVPYF
jgi:hypothetical protein